MNEMMKAAVNERYGSPEVLEVRNAPKPEPKTGEVLVRVHATTVNRTDWGMLEPHPFFIRLMTGLISPKLKILGMDFAGTVAALGPGTSQFKVGDRVFGMSPDDFGAHAEYICIPEGGPVAPLPKSVGYSDAVICEGSWYADNCLRGLGVKSGDNILIYGASGAIGVAGLQLAKAIGARVTAVVATRHVELAHSLGADEVIDYTAQDFTQTEEKFDAVFDAVGKTTYFRCRKLLKPGARYATTDLGPWAQNIFLSVWFGLTGSRRASLPMPKQRPDFVDSLAKYLETGALRAVVDRSYPLEAIADAYRHVITGEKTGIVVINVQAGDGDLS